MVKKLELFFSNPVSYERLTIEMQPNREKIAEINGENGGDNLEIELFGTGLDAGFVAQIPLDEFIDKLIEARDLIREVA